MKRQSYKGLAAFAMATAMLTGCKLIGDVEYTLDKDPVEMHGDSVKVNITVKVPEKGLNKKAIAEITPMLGDKAFKTITIQGEKATGNGQTINFKPGGTVNYSDVIPYSPDLEVSDLKVTGVVKKGSKEVEIEEKKIGDGTIITPLLVQNDDKAIMAPDQFVRTTEEAFTGSNGIQINFDKAKSNVKSSEVKQADIKELEEFLTASMTNAKVAPKSIELISYASPEGEVGKNGELATDRANNTKVVVDKMLEKIEYKATKLVVNTNPKGEDWAGFKTAVEASDLEDKELIVRVLSMYKDPVQREEEIKKMAKTYKKLERDILPPLRRTQIKVIYDKIGWSDEELKALSVSNPDTLNVEELLFTATLYDDLGEKMRLYKEVVRQYPEDWRGYNNLGGVYYMQNDMSNAKTNFEKANSLNENAISLNNLGIIARQEGDRVKAAELFNSALSAGSEVKYNLGIIDIQNGDYEQAIGNMGSENTFNKALAQVLNGDYDAAMSTLDASADADSALGYYLKAIIGARQNNLDLLVNNLTSAIAKDSSLKAKAAKDREFIKFFDNAAFAALVK
ncbi:MAG: tetratricopeptide repeat protein [Putridiphycobacter sp.]